MASILKLASRISVRTPLEATDPAKEGYLKCQRLALRAAHEISSLLKEGWTETQAASLMDTFLRDHGVAHYFHHPFAWFGERTRFDGIGSYAQYQPSRRVLRPGEVYILDAAPILDGYIADIGFTASLGQNLALTRAEHFLDELYETIPRLFEEGRTGGEIWDTIDEKIREAGYDNIHKKYPFSVLGHRVHETADPFGGKVLHFGWQAYWSLLSRGLFGQLLTKNHAGSLLGLWAIEPHLGGKDFGAKFEEILVVEKDRAYWLEPKR